MCNDLVETIAATCAKAHSAKLDCRQVDDNLLSNLDQIKDQTHSPLPEDRHVYHSTIWAVRCK